MYAGTVYRQWGHRAAFLAALALLPPPAANGLRVYTTILLDHLGATYLVAGMGHYLYGVLIFGMVMGVLFMTCGRWREEPSTGEAPVSLPQGRAAVMSTASTRRTLLCAAIAMLLVAIGPLSVRVLRLPRGSEETVRPNPPAASGRGTHRVQDRSPTAMWCRLFSARPHSAHCSPVLSHNRPTRSEQPILAACCRLPR